MGVIDISSGAAVDITGDCESDVARTAAHRRVVPHRVETGASYQARAT